MNARSWRAAALAAPLAMLGPLAQAGARLLELAHLFLREHP
jgi:hypothetical protein